jgi:hypothetical protein
MMMIVVGLKQRLLCAGGGSYDVMHCVYVMELYFLHYLLMYVRVPSFFAVFQAICLFVYLFRGEFLGVSQSLLCRLP